MNCPDIVSSMGLILDIAGVALLFKYGLPADVKETGGTTIVWGGGKSDEEAKGEYRHYKRMSRIGLGCLVIGFLLQLISNFLS